MLVAGNWHTLAKLESELAKLGESTGLTIAARRTETAAAADRHVPYSVDVVCLDQPGVAARAGRLLRHARHRHRRDLHAHLPAAHTGAPMFAVQMMVHVPTRIHVAQLREEFMDYCDRMNLDAILEPVKA